MPAHKVDVGYMNPLDIKGIKRNCLCLKLCERHFFVGKMLCWNV